MFHANHRPYEDEDERHAAAAIVEAGHDVELLIPFRRRHPCLRSGAGLGPFHVSPSAGQFAGQRCVLLLAGGGPAILHQPRTARRRRRAEARNVDNVNVAARHIRTAWEAL
jgi:hypothetical protein